MTADCILDLRGVLGCNPLVIDDKHRSAPRIRGVKLPVIDGLDPVASSLQPVDHPCYCSFGLLVEVFLTIVFILMGLKPFRISGGPYFPLEFVTG